MKLVDGKVRNQELSRNPNPEHFLKIIAGTNGRRTAEQLGGVLQYKWEMYGGVPYSSRLRSQKRVAIQMGGIAVQIGGVLLYFSQVAQAGGSQTLILKKGLRLLDNLFAPSSHSFRRSEESRELERSLSQDHTDQSWKNAGPMQSQGRVCLPSRRFKPFNLVLH